VKYPLELLLKIRHDREEAAIQRLAQSRREEEKRRFETSARRREFNDYRVWCAAESERILSKLSRSVVRKAEIDRAHAQILWNQEAESVYRERLEAAIRAGKEAQGAVAEAAEARRVAGMARERIAAHRQEWTRIRQLAEEAAEESELQEVAELLYLQSASA
jgi:hypothetical protein